MNTLYFIGKNKIYILLIKEVLFMKNYILDSTYKDSIVIDNNNNPFITPTYNLSNTLMNSTSIDLNKANSNYISHHKFNDNLNNYSFIDSL